MTAPSKELRISRELWRKRMSQAECARRSGVQPSSMSRIVRGLEPAYPKRGQRIADALGWEGDPSELFEEVGDDELAAAY